MEKVTLETESYLIEGTENDRFFPFFELEFNEIVIYENDVPKYYLSFSDDLKSAYGIGNWILIDLEENEYKLRDVVVKLGKSLDREWDIYSSNLGRQIDGSWKLERIELALLTDKEIENIKTHYNKE